MITLEGLGPLRIAVAGVALHSGVAPVVLLALVAPPTPEPGFAVALPNVRVARLPGGPHGVTVAVLAAHPAGQLPMILKAAIKRTKIIITYL